VQAGVGPATIGVTALTEFSLRFEGVVLELGRNLILELCLVDSLELHVGDSVLGRQNEFLFFGNVMRFTACHWACVLIITLFCFLTLLRFLLSVGGRGGTDPRGRALSLLNSRC